ncbi:MAG: PD40 domain-containing protein [Dehalococcoidia bacterium]|nr:PD40 domain-containing protein [Dehalococcoidia bacterium]
MQQLRAESVTDRQRQVLDGVAAGKSNGVIAGELGITIDGVKWHVSELLWASGCTDRHELGEWWRRQRPRSASSHAFWLPAWPWRGTAAASLRVGVMLVLTAAIVAGIYVAATRGSSQSSTIGASLSTASLGKIAYVDSGDIFVKTLPDGARQRLTSFQTDATATQPYAAPSWSAAGDWLSFRQGGDAGVMRTDGSDARVLSTTSVVVWSPADDRLAYATGGGDLVVERADGSDRRTIASWHAGLGVDGALSAPIWSADGTEIAYVEDRANRDGSRYAGIWVANRDGFGLREVYRTEVGSRDSLQLLSWGPQQVLFARLPSSTADVADGGTIEVASTIAEQPPVHIVPRNPAGLLDGGWISRRGRSGTFVLDDGLGRETWANKRIGVLQTVTGVFYDLTPSGVAATDPAFSPDGTRIAYAAMPDAGAAIGGGEAAKAALARRKIWLMDTQVGEQLGVNQRAFTSDPAYRDEYPQWSSDGAAIVFVRIDAQGRASIWIVAATGGVPRAVVPGWSPDTLAAASGPVGYFGRIAWAEALSWWRPPGAVVASASTPSPGGG